MISFQKSGSDREANSIPASSFQQFENEAQDHHFGVETVAFTYRLTVTCSVHQLLLTPYCLLASFALCYVQ